MDSPCSFLRQPGEKGSDKPVPSYTLKAYEKTRADITIDSFAKLENPTISDLNFVKVQGDVQCGIDQYRCEAAGMSQSQLEGEVHNSVRMASLMASSGDLRPASAEYCHCHAMVSGSHNEAATIRAVMAWCLMGIDDPRNGCWLPRNSKARPYMPAWLRNAVPHSKIHRKSYYRWLGDLVNPILTKSNRDLINTLKIVRMRLQSGSIPRNIASEIGL